MLTSIFEKHKICSNHTDLLLVVNWSNIISKKVRILLWSGVLLFDFAFFLQCYKPQHNSFKIVLDLDLIKVIDLH